MFLRKAGRSNISFLDIIKGYGNTIKEYINFFLLCRKKYENYFAVLLQVWLKKYPIVAILRIGQKITFKHNYQVYNNLADLNCDVEYDIVYIKGLTFYGGQTNGDIESIFVKNEYGYLPIKDKVVVDIGASIGDSSIFFISRGARKVIALEPNRESYELAKKNIEANCLSDKIEIVWTAGGAVDANNNNNNTVSYIPPFMTLETIIDKYQIEESAILKIDCEGCEYPLILSTPNNLLAKFSYLQIEYHYGYKNLKEKLEECGFHVDVTGPAYCKLSHYNPTTTLFYHNGVKQNNNKAMFIGWIYAKK